jgi:hypothetical protein
MPAPELSFVSTFSDGTREEKMFDLEAIFNPDAKTVTAVTSQEANDEPNELPGDLPVALFDLDAIFDPDAKTAPGEISQEANLEPNKLSGDWLIEWEERAAIMEYDGRLPRERAEARALADIRQKLAPTTATCF